MPGVSSHKRAFRGSGDVAISNFEFRISQPPEEPQRHREGTEGNTEEFLVFRLDLRHSRGTGDLAVFATRGSSSTVDIPQSASNAIFHSYLSESLVGRSPSWLSEGGWARRQRKRPPEVGGRCELIVNKEFNSCSQQLSCQALLRGEPSPLQSSLGRAVPAPRAVPSRPRERDR